MWPDGPSGIASLTKAIGDGEVVAEVPWIGFRAGSIALGYGL